MKVLVVVDMQNDFVSGALGTEDALTIVPKTAERVAVAAAGEERILFTRDTHEEDYMDTQEGRKLPVPHCIRGSWGWQIIPQLAEYANGRMVVDKPTFGSAELGRTLATMHGQEPIEKITFIGLCTDICVISNVLMTKAFLPEVEIAVDASCCAGVSAESHQNALDAMRVCQITVENG